MVDFLAHEFASLCRGGHSFALTLTSFFNRFFLRHEHPLSTDKIAENR